MLDIDAYPDGNITFVFTDIEGSSRTTSELEKVCIGMYEEKLRDPHRQRLLDGASRYNGHEIHRAGDGHLLVFQFAEDALNCVVSFQQSLHADPIVHTEGGTTYEIKVRVGVHTAVDQRKPTKMENGLPEYSGTDTNFAARIGNLGMGGQIIVSQSAHNHARKLSNFEKSPCAVIPWPGRFLKSFPGPNLVYEILYYPDQKPCEPGMRWFSEIYRSGSNTYIERSNKENEVSEGFDTRGVRIVTITGIGGTGKTRLAIACAAKRANLYDDGVYFVSLAIADLVENPQAVDTSRNVEFVAQMIGEALNVSNENRHPEPLFQTLRTKNLLLVLDNYEAVCCDAVGQYLMTIATETVGVSLLITGRSPIGADNAEVLVSLNDGMTLDEARTLFIDRARLKKPLPEPIAPEDETQLNRILELTDRIPLALELAAAHIARYSLKQIADGIENTPLGEMGTARGLRHDDLIAFQRNRSLERSLTWSYNLLSENEQRVLCTTSLFADTFDDTTLEIIHGDEESKRGLDALLDASLVSQNNTQQSSDAYRFRLHRSTRVYAATKSVEMPSINDTLQRFIKHYRNLIANNSDMNNGTHHIRLIIEWRNVCMAVYIAEKQSDWISVLKLCNLDVFLHIRGAWLEQISLGLTALRAANKLGSYQDEARVLNNLGIAYKSLGYLEEAEKSFEQSIAIKRKMGDRAGVGKTLGNLGHIYHHRGGWADAEQTFGEQLLIAQASDDLQEIANALGNLANVYISRHQWLRAEEVCNKSLTIYLQLGNRLGEAKALGTLGEIYRGQSRLNDAEEAFQLGYAIFDEFGDRDGICETLRGLGNIYQHRKQWDRAREAYEFSLNIAQTFGDRISEAKTIGALGVLYKNQHLWAEAKDALQMSMKIFSGLADNYGQGMVLQELGGVYQGLNQWNQAADTYYKCLTIFQIIGNRQSERNTLLELGNTHSGLRQWNEAKKFYERTLLISTELGDEKTEAQVLLIFGNLYGLQAQWTDAEQSVQKSLAIFRKLSDRQEEGRALKKLGAIYTNCGLSLEAEEALQESLTICRASEDRYEEACVLINLGSLYLSSGNLEGARQTYNDSLMISNEVGCRNEQGLSLFGIGLTFMSMRNWVEAKREFQQSLVIFQDLRDNIRQGQIFDNLALVSAEQNRRIDAIAFARKSLAIFEQTEDVRAIARSRSLLAALRSQNLVYVTGNPS